MILYEQHSIPSPFPLQLIRRHDDDHRVPGGHVGVDAAEGLRLRPVRPPRRRQGRRRVLRQDQAEESGEQASSHRAT